MTTRNVLIQVASLQREKMTVCRETLSHRMMPGPNGLPYVEIWGYEKPDHATRAKHGGKCTSMKLRDAVLDYVQSEKFDWADDDIHGVHPMGWDLEKVRSTEGGKGFLLKVAVLE